MTSPTAPSKKGKAGKAKAKTTTGKTTDRDNGLERVYARLEPDDKKLLDQLASDDERSTMKYLERLIRKHLDQVRKKTT